MNDDDEGKFVYEDDLDVLFKRAVPLTITITKPSDLVALTHCILREHFSGFQEESDIFLSMISRKCKEVGIEQGVNESLKELPRFTPLSFFPPLLKHMMSHFLDPQNREEFNAYLKSKEEDESE